MISTITYPLAPVCLFVYKRLDTLKETVKSLQKNELAQQSDLYIFSDAAGKASDEAAVDSVRSFCKAITGFKSVSIVHSERNLGLAASVIKGVSSIIDEYDKVIVLEDDLVVSQNFLNFMNEALDFFKGNNRMFSVAGYSSPMQSIENEDVYFTKRASCWGWGTWKDKWDTIDWNVKDYEHFIRDRRMQRQFNLMGSDLTGMLKKQQEGKINSWAIRWTYEQFKRDQYTVFPVISKVSNEGFGEQATHTSKNNRSRFSTILDTSGKTKFRFPEEPYLEPHYLRQFTDRYSIKTRALYKIKSILN
jgi:hypothetical protein